MYWEVYILSELEGIILYSEFPLSDISRFREVL